MAERIRVISVMRTRILPACDIHNNLQCHGPERSALEGGKLTGTVSVLDMETKIEDSKYKDGDVSFTVNREMDGNKFTIKYNGKIKGDTFKGKRELERDGQTNTREFEAKRVKE